MRSAYFPIDRGLHRERERLCPSVKWWKHGNGTISIIWDLHISLLIGDCRERARERERLCPSMKWWKHRNCTISVIWDLHISLSIGKCIESESERKQEGEREAMSICETVKTQKWYYLCNMRSAYFPIDRGLHRERAREREKLCPSMKWWKHRNCAISIIQDLHISLLIGECIERESERERESKRERDYVHLWNGENTEMILCP